MPKEKVTRGKGKATKADSGKKKKGTQITCTQGSATFLTSDRPQRPQARSLCLHVLRQRAAWQGPRGQPRHQVRWV